MGFCEYKSSEGGVLITRWHDNSTVIVASSVHTVYILSKGEALFKKEKKTSINSKATDCSRIRQIYERGQSHGWEHKHT